MAVKNIVGFVDGVARSEAVPGTRPRCVWVGSRHCFKVFCSFSKGDIERVIRDILSRDGADAHVVLNVSGFQVGKSD